LVFVSVSDHHRLLLHISPGSGTKLPATSVTCVVHVDRDDVHPERRRQGLNRTELADPGRNGRIPEDPHSPQQHIRNGLLHVTQEKTGKPLALPIHPELATILAAVPATQMTFVMTLRGKPFTPHAFTAWFAEACDKAGLPSTCTFHGLRKAACRRLAEAGCTPHEIMAISGHTTLKEVVRYTEAVDQERMARAAMARTMAAIT
jgi:hypothetical protein